MASACQAIFNIGWSALNIDIPLFEYSFTLWQLLCFSVLLGGVMKLINGVLERSADD